MMAAQRDAGMMAQGRRTDLGLKETQVETAPLTLSEMQRLYTFGHSLVPLGGGEDGKSPLTAFRGRKRLPNAVVQQRMTKASSAIYGVRLAGMVVVDADTCNAATEAYIQRRFGASTVQVQSPRGRHHYFKAGATIPKRVREDGIAIDFKHGPNAYVAGAGSVRPDGGAYVADVGELAKISDLPSFIDREPEADQSPLIPAGERTFHIWERAREFVETVDSVDALTAELQSVRDWELASPDTYSDARLIKAADWAWSRRLSNDIWGGAKSAVKTYRDEFEALMAVQNGVLGLALLHVLRHNHNGAARKGKSFRIVREAMADAEIIPNWNANHYRRAKNALLEAGLIRCVKAGNRFAGPSEYRFASLAYAGGEGFLLHSGGYGTPKTAGLR